MGLPIVIVNPNTIKVNFIVHGMDQDDYASDNFSFPVEERVIWRVQIDIKPVRSKWLLEPKPAFLYDVELILVESQSFVRRVGGKMTLTGVRRKNIAEKTIGTKFLKYPHEAPSIKFRFRNETPQREHELEIMVNHDMRRDISDDLAKCLFAKEFSDVVLEVDGEDIPAHKVILSARSNYFGAMFKSVMKEDQESRVKITDFSATVIKELLRYLYTGKLGNVRDLYADLRTAADKYDVEDLDVALSGWCMHYYEKNPFVVLAKPSTESN